MFEPKPIDTSDIVVPEELCLLSEKIAENVHNVWAYNRLMEGWTYGEKTDSKKKTTPWLVPYNELPESEKDYDRNTALQTIKVILKSGFTISNAE